MSNSYNMGQQWNQSQLNFGPLQLEQEYEFGTNDNRQQQQQMLHQRQQQSYVPGNAYHNQYSQQQQQVQNPNAHPSSLMGAFSSPLSQQHSHSRSSSFGAAQSGQNSMSGAYAGMYASQAAGPASNGANGPYRQPNSSAFTFSPPSAIPMALQNNMSDVSQGGSPSYLTSSPGPLHESFSPPSSSSQLQQEQQGYFNSNDAPGAPQPKRHHGSAFKDESVVDDPDSELGQSDTKDKQSKLSVLLLSIYAHWIILLMDRNLGRGHVRGAKTSRSDARLRRRRSLVNAVSMAGTSVSFPGGRFVVRHRESYLILPFLYL